MNDRNSPNRKRIDRRVHNIQIARLLSENSRRPANSTNGMTFAQLICSLKGVL